MTPNEHGLASGYSEALGLRLCSAERSNQPELTAVQPSIVFVEDYNPAQLLFQDVETGLYLLNVRGLKSEYARVEAERDSASVRAVQAETERESANTRAVQAETERDAASVRAAEAEAEVARLREQIRRMKPD